jgi:hypothetical protein
MLTSWRRDRKIRGVLRGIARQRVVAILPGNIRVVEKALKRTETNEAALATCMMRGWVGVLEENVPVGDLTPEGALPTGALYSRTETQYRLTEGGWAAINRAHMWLLTNVALAALAIVAAVVIAFH